MPRGNHAMRLIVAEDRNGIRAMQPSRCLLHGFEQVVDHEGRKTH